MARRLSSVKQSPERMLTHFQLDLKELKLNEN